MCLELMVILAGDDTGYGLALYPVPADDPNGMPIR